MKLKICGMKDNTAEVATLQPDYLGFIFYDKSPRHFEGVIPELPKSIKKVGVFVDEAIDIILQKIKKYDLDVIQLHSKEDVHYCASLKFECHILKEQNRPANWGTHGGKFVIEDYIDKKIIKVFSIKDEFDFSQLKPYEEYVDYFLFDTKGRLPGGNGYTFNWDVLKEYPSTKPYFLSGGIGLGELQKIKEFIKDPTSKYCYAIDVNSKFEIEPGLKSINELEKFIYELQH